MKNIMLKLFLVATFLSINICAKDMGTITNSQWANLHLYKGVNQRGGPFAFDDTYVELEFGGRYEWLDLYGYVVKILIEI